jgi:prepilin-type N-terminal cleavage/methylation domain-containing protein/prepilin-type processing-associated H-X9-DG protein
MTPLSRRGCNGIGFTLIELLVVIGIIGVLFGLAFAAIQIARASALRSQCSNNLRQIGLALHHHHDTQGAFPSGVSYQGGMDPFLFMSWQARLLPFLEQQDLWNATVQAFAQSRRFSENPPHVGFATLVPVYSCAADSRTGEVAEAPLQFGSAETVRVALTAYLGVEGVDQSELDGTLYVDSHTRMADIRDGTSNTLLVGERPPSADKSFGWWYGGAGQNLDGSADEVLGVREFNTGNNATGCPPGPYHFRPGSITNQCDVFHFWSLHPGGAHFLLADGSVHFLSYSADSVLPALSTRAGGEKADVP